MMGLMTPPGTDTFPRQNARTLRFTLGRPRSFNVSPDGSTVLFVRSGSGTDRVGRLWRWTQEEGEVELVNPTDLLAGTDEVLSPEEQARRERAREAAGGIVAYTVDADFSRVAYAVSGRLFLTSIAGAAETSEIPTAAPVIDPRIDPTGQRIAFVSQRRLQVVDIDQGAPRPLSPPEEDENVIWGLADFIAAEELDRSRGFWWSPDGQRLLAQRTDESPVATWFVSNPATPGSAPTEQRYPAAGTANAQVALWLIGLDGALSEVLLPTGSEYLASVDWTERGDPVVGTLDRAQQSINWLAVDPGTGSTRPLRTVTDPTWVDVVPGAGCWDTSGRLLTVEVRDGDYALCVDGRRMSPPGLQVRALLAVARTHITVLGAERAGDQQVWRLTESSAELLSQADGWSTSVEGGDATVVVTADLDHAHPRVVIRTPSLVHQVASLADTPIIEPRVTLLPGDSDQPRVALLLPTWWDPEKGSLPVLMDPYGGPHHTSVAHHQGAFRESQWFADQGFAVVVVDGRGTPGDPTGERAIRGDFAGPVLEDQVVGLHAAAHTFPALDLDRVGIRGWSFGGYLAALAVIDRPDVFHAAVAGAPVTDWRLYDTGYTERYLGVPSHADDDAYRRSSLLERAAGLTRPLQLIHGLADDNVFVAHTLQLSSVLTENGCPHEVLPLTGITHMATREDVAENLLTLQVDFLRRALAIDHD
jgi:dipeptidyl-peptidase-4